jgi:hypothetical protein
MSVQHGLTPHELETKLAATGWTFFYLAGAIRMTACGFDWAKTINAAMKRVIKSVRQQRCNCLQIDEVAAHSFLGVPYVSVSAHARHVQRGMVFEGQDFGETAKTTAAAQA